MNTLFLVIIIALLIYLLYKMRKVEANDSKSTISYQKILPEYVKKTCEIILKEPLAPIDIMFSVKGILVDVDDEWVMMEVEHRKKNVLKLFKIHNISSIKELK